MKKKLLLCLLFLVTFLLVHSEGSSMKNPESITQTKQKKYKNIIFDLGGVLINFNPKQVIKDLFSNETHPPFELLEIFHMQPVYDVCKGLISQDEMIDRLAKESKFDKEKIANFFHEIPRRLAPLSQGISFLKKAKKNGYKIYLLSNIDESCYNIIHQHNFFNIVDGALMSYEHNCAKPEPEIYEKLLNMYNLKAEECLFIDDFQENIDGAQACNIDGIVCDDHDNVEKKLIELGIL